MKPRHKNIPTPWTIPSLNWEGVNWGLFSGDDGSMKVFIDRIVEHMQKLKIKNLMYPEWGHAYLATRYGLQRWHPVKYVWEIVADILVIS